jgi:hypothetical protein
LNIYSLPTAANTKHALLAATGGVGRVATSPFGTNWPGVGTVYLQLGDGRWLALEAGQQDLEDRFEVFLIEASIIDSKPETKLECEYALSPPVSVIELETEDWLDPATPCGETLGSNPITQYQDLPGRATKTASAKCNHVSGVHFVGSNGNSLVVATLTSPYSLYCSLFPEGATERDSPHVQAPRGAA